MTPAAIRIVTQLRREFYSLFCGAMKVPVHTTENAYTSSFSMASWVDQHQRLNYVCLYAHTAPDELVPERPLVIRIAVNKGAGVVTQIRREKGCQGVNRSWHFELTLLPEELVGFLPWLVRLIESYDTRSVAGMPPPPYPLDDTISNALLVNQAQTYNASAQLAQPVQPLSDQVLC